MKGLKSANNRGFTLVEVFVASILAFLVTLALLGAQVSARHLTHKARLHMEAANTVQRLLEQQKALPYGSIGVVSLPPPTIVLSDNGTAGVLTDDVNGIVTATVDFDDPVLNTKTITISIQWTQHYFGQDRVSNVTLTTIVSNV